MTLAERLALLKNSRGADKGDPPANSVFVGGTGNGIDNGLGKGAGNEVSPESEQPQISQIPLIPLNVRLQRLSGGDFRTRASRTKCNDADVAKHLRGEVIAPGVIQIDQTIPLASRHGKVIFSALADIPLAVLGLPNDAPLDGLLFLDTETTGLAGGTGTLPFMVCLARIQGDCLQLGQWILTGFAGEAALLGAIFDWIETATHLVSYNGKSFDVPLLATRYRLARQTDPFADKGHIDLLHLTRRAYGHGWDDCRLQTAEQRLLGYIREDDFPSHLIPQAWTDFVRGGRVEPLHAIAEHNQRDVLSLAALLAMLAQAYTEPGHEAVNALKVAQIHAGRGDIQYAIDHLTGAWGGLDEAALLFLAKLHRHQRQDEQAIAIWMHLGENKCVRGIEALAKYHEHVTHELEAALALAEELLRLEPAMDIHIRRQARLCQRLVKFNPRKEKGKRRVGI
jgi:uncharacterized protein YprB with RNaseH-like and TPR domain